MIGRLRGELVEKNVPTLILDVGGVGYELEASLNTMVRLPEVGGEVILYTHMVTREDAQLLYGFLEQRERTLFRSLIRVNGIGPRLALAMLSGMEVPEIVRCIRENDTAALVRLPGIGKRTAERLIIDLRDRLGDGLGDLADIERSGKPRANLDLMRDAESALIALGYRPQDAAIAVSGVDTQTLASPASVEEIIKLALRNIR